MINEQMIQKRAEKLGLTVRIIRPRTATNRYEFLRGHKLVGTRTGGYEAITFLEEYEEETQNMPKEVADE